MSYIAAINAYLMKFLENISFELVYAIGMLDRSENRELKFYKIFGHTISPDTSH